MLAVLLKQAPASVTAVRAAFEAVGRAGSGAALDDGGGTLVAAGRAGWSRTASSRHSNGPVRLADPVAEEALKVARSPFLASDELPSPDGTMGAHLYVGILSTVSAYLELPTSEQEQVYSRILQVLPATVEVVADITVHLARREHWE